MHFFLMGLRSFQPIFILFGFVDISLLPTFSTIYFDPLVLLSEEALVSPSRGDKGPRVVAHDVLLPQHGGAGGALGDQGHPPPTQNAPSSQ